ncbi:hypothetical protein SE17_16515, partial [Kouleothrix aurantiaca]
RATLGSAVVLEPAEAGMHLVGWLGEHVDDLAIAARAAAQGLEVPALRRYAAEAPLRGGLLLGYTALDAAQIRAGLQRLAGVL